MPVAFDLGALGWAPTIELTGHVRAHPAPGWLRIEISTQNVIGGLLEEDASSGTPPVPSSPSPASSPGCGCPSRRGGPVTDIVAAVAALDRLPGIAERDRGGPRGVHPAALARGAATAGSPRRPPSPGCAGHGRAATSTAPADPLAIVRDVMRGAAAWSDPPDPVERVMRGRRRRDGGERAAGRRCFGGRRCRPSPACTPPAAVGTPRGRPARPTARRGGGMPRARRPRYAAPGRGGPGAAGGPRRPPRRGREQLPALLVVAVVHAEIATARPFVRGNAVVARAVERAAVRGARPRPDRGRRARGRAPSGRCDGLPRGPRGIRDRDGRGDDPLWSTTAPRRSGRPRARASRSPTPCAAGGSAEVCQGAVTFLGVSRSSGVSLRRRSTTRGAGDADPRGRRTRRRTP